MAGPGTNTDLSHPQDSNAAMKYQGDVFTLRCTFSYKDTAVLVSDGFVRIRRVDATEYSAFRAPGSAPTDASMTKWTLNAPLAGSTVYSVDIDPMSLDLGWYSVEFYGKANTGAGDLGLKIEGKFEIAALSRRERIANRVRIQLADQDIEDYIEAAGLYQKFRGQSILSFVEDGINWINGMGPRVDSYTMDTLPEHYDWALQQYAWAMCMLAKARNFIDNDLQVSDTHSLIQAKFEKYKGMYDLGYKMAMEYVVAHKKATPPMAAGLRRRKYPLIFYYRGLATTSANYWSGSFTWSY